MESQFKIGKAYKTLRWIFTYNGSMETDETFTVLQIDRLPDLPDPFLEYPPTNFKIQILHDNQIKLIQSMLLKEHVDFEEII